eukprot:ctg_277.g118
MDDRYSSVAKETRLEARPARPPVPGRHPDRPSGRYDAAGGVHTEDGECVGGGGHSSHVAAAARLRHTAATARLPSRTQLAPQQRVAGAEHVGGAGVGGVGERRRHAADIRSGVATGTGGNRARHSGGGGAGRLCRADGADGERDVIVGGLLCVLRLPAAAAGRQQWRQAPTTGGTAGEGGARGA